MGMTAALVAMGVSAGGQVGAGRAAKRAANAQAQQIDIAAGQEIAAGQRRAEEERHQAALLASRAQAVAAASGGGASDPTVLTVISNIHARGEYDALVANYEASERARSLRLKGEAARTEGKSQENAGYIRGASTLLESGTSLYGKYGKGGYKESLG